VLFAWHDIGKEKIQTSIINPWWWQCMLDLALLPGNVQLKKKVENNNNQPGVGQGFFGSAVCSPDDGTA